MTDADRPHAPSLGPPPSPAIVGLMGSVGSGKTTVARAFERRGARVEDADAIVHELYMLPTVRRRVVETFGDGILDPDRRIDRAALGREVFGSKERLARLTGIVHPLVLERLDAAIAKTRASGPGGPVLVLDVPLLLETGLDARCSHLVFVDASPEVRERRIAGGGKLSPEDAERRARLQAGLEEKRRRADVVIDNGGTREATDAQVERFWREGLGR